MRPFYFHRDNEPMVLYVLRIASVVLLGLAGFVLIAFLLGIFVVYLWNWLMPDLFGLKQITFWQAFGILILARIIFGGFHHHPRHHHPMDRRAYFLRRKHLHGKNPFSKWQYYDEFWEAEGEKAYDEYVKQKASTDPERA